MYVELAPAFLHIGVCVCADCASSCHTTILTRIGLVVKGESAIAVVDRRILSQVRFILFQIPVRTHCVCRIAAAEDTYMKMFNSEVEAFIARVHARAAQKREEAMKEVCGSPIDCPAHGSV